MISDARHLILAGMILCGLLPARAQDYDWDRSGIVRGLVRDGDTIPVIEIPEISIYETDNYQYLFMKRRYRRLIRNVKKAYPYAKIAGHELKALDRRLAMLDSERERKAYVKQAEQQIMERFEKEIRKLTITQGIILVKLIDRETGRTSYEVIKDIKGGLTAFFWQGIARIFGNNLKTEYDPENQDRVIEDIVLGIEAGLI